MRRKPLTTRLLAVPLLAAMALAACGGDDDSGGPAAGSAAESAGSTESVTLRLGYFPNVTHATALAGVESGTLAAAVGPNVKLETQTYNAGPEAVEALFSEALDVTFIGPNPAINAYAQSGGEAIRIISGATSGGASFVVKPEITGPADLAGARLATPSLGNTQDVALRWWLQEQGLTADAEGGGDVSILPQENSATLDAFKAGDIEGAWVPEPWATRLIQEGGGKVLVDERDLWPDGRFVTTHVVVRTAFLEEHPDAVAALLDGVVQATELVNADPAAAQKQVNDQIEAITGKRINDDVLAAAWGNLEFTTDPVASSLQGSADHAIAVGLLDDVDLAGIYDLGLLNQVLAKYGAPPVEEL